MLVFISWSGDRSRAAAQTLRTWLKDVLQMLEPWVSSEDIRHGARWSVEIAKNLESAGFGIICVTRENLNEPWILFESGALAKTLDRSLVCPYLLNLKPTELTGPLVQFQAAQANESDTRKLIHSINRALGNDALPEDKIDRAYTKWWPELRDALQSIPEKGTSVANQRSDRELLEEVLEIVRSVNLKREASVTSPRRLDSLTRLATGLFGVGPDVSGLLTKVDSLGTDKDQNASDWHIHAQLTHAHELDGQWFTRWNGGIADEEWVSGIAELRVFEDRLYALSFDGRSDCLIATRRLDADILAGRYINLGSPSEVVPWVGRVVSTNRIDGIWSQGRWDLHR